MNAFPTKAYTFFTLFLLLSFAISCSKDSDLLDDVFFEKDSADIEKKDDETEEEETEEETEEEETETESRTTSFYPLHDAYIQNEIGYNQSIVRLQENNRVSYLMYNLEPIANIKGVITDAIIGFTVKSDDGHGEIEVSKGKSSNWSETELTESTAPEKENILFGRIDDIYAIGATIEIPLTIDNLDSEKTTLILSHNNGDDLAFASKEHPDNIAPRLIITYNVPVDAIEITQTGEIDPDSENNPENEAPLAIIKTNLTTGKAPLTVNFDASSSSDDKEITSFLWKFMDNETSNISKPEFTFNEIGTYEIELTVTDNEGLSHTSTILISAEGFDNETPKAVASATPTEGKAPLEVQFSSQNSSDDKEIISYYWEFRDGSTATSKNPSHLFNTPGEYEVSLTVKDAENLTHENIILIKVSEPENEAPKATVTANINSGIAPLDVKFSSNDSTDDKEIVSYLWDFKDGKTGTSRNPTHTFSDPGNFAVTLTVKDKEGLQHTDNITITVEASTNEAPIAVAKSDVKNGVAPLNVQFISNSSTDDKEITHYHWDFKDGNTTTNKNPSHSFTNPGTYEVILTVKDKEGLEDSNVVAITITGTNNDNESPNASISANPVSGNAPLNVQFSSDGSSDDKEITSYLWNFKDGITSNAPNPSHTFEEPGTYSVSLTVKDQEGKEHKKNITITVNESSSEGEYPEGAVKASSFGYNTNDATDALEAALKSNHSVIIIDKKSGWVIRPLQIFNISNKTIIFENNVIIKAKNGTFTNENTDRLLEFIGCKNLILDGYGATLSMNKSEYNSGEGRHALSLLGCTDIEIKGFTIKDSGGDGIYIAGSTNKDFSENITVEDVDCVNNRRQGMSIISAQNVWVRNSTFRDTKGALPEAGVDLEPNKASDRLININFSNCRFTNNKYAGIALSLWNLTSSSRPISIAVNDSYFSYNSSNDNDYIESEIVIKANLTNPVKGNVEFNNITVDGSKWGAIYARKPANAFHVTFKNFVAKNISTDGRYPGIKLEASTNPGETTGGFTFDNFYMEYSKNIPFISIEGPGSTVGSATNIQGDFTIKEPYDNPPRYLGFKSSENINVNITYNHIN